jgi:hypothetical protein
MIEFRVLFYHQKTYVEVQVKTWANNPVDALTKAVESLANPLLRHISTTAIGHDRP